jgi:hypothetical protein
MMRGEAYGQRGVVNDVMYSDAYAKAENNVNGGLLGHAKRASTLWSVERGNLACWVCFGE